MSGWTSIASALRSPSWTPPVPAAQPQPGHDPATLIPVLGALAPGTPVAGAGRSRHRRGPDPVDWSRAGLAGQPRAAAHPRAILQDCCGLLDAPWRPRSPGWNGKSMRWPSPTHGQARMALPGVGRLTARTLVAELGDLGRFSTAPAVRRGRAAPQVRNSDRKLGHGHITKQAHPGCARSCRRPPRRQRQPMVAGASGDLARRPGNHIATTAITRRLLARSCHIRIQVWRQHRRRLVPGAFAFAHAPATRPLTGLHSPGPDFPSCGPRLRARMGAGEPTPTRRPGLLHHLVPPSATATAPPAGRSLHAPRQGPAP